MQAARYLKRESWNTAGGAMIAPFDNISPDFVIQQIMISIYLTGIKAASTTMFGNAAALAWTDPTLTTLLDIAQLGVLVPSVRLDSEWADIDMKGNELLFLYNDHCGKDVSEIGGTNSSTTAWSLYLNIPIMLWDPTSVKPNDSAIPARLLKGKSLMVTECGPLPTAFYGTSTASITSGTIDVWALGFEDTAENPTMRVPQKRVMRHYNPGGQTVYVPDGTVIDAFLCHDDVSAFTAAELSSLSASFNGREVLPAMFTPEEACELWNTLTCRDIYNAGLQWPSRRAPIISPAGANYEITKMPKSDGQGSTVQLAGTISAPNIVIWAGKPTAENEIRSAARSYGVNENAAVVNATIATASAKPLSSAPGTKEAAHKATILPKRITPPAQSVRRTNGMGPGGSKGPSAFRS